MVAVAAIVMIILSIRLYRIDADPPVELSRSSDVYTDTGQYTIFARYFIQTGQFNPLHDYRFSVFLKSSVTALAVVVFKLLGVGVWQSNLIGVLYAFGALMLFALFLWRVAGKWTFALFLLFAGLDFNLLFYGRLPFLEHAMAFWVFLGLVLITYGRGWAPFLLGGMALGVGIFFGKIVGMVFLFPFSCYFLYRMLNNDERFPRIRWTKVGLFALGFTTTTLFWYFFTYLPMKALVAGYLEEQTVSLYGSPEALNSVGDFFYKLLTFGIFSQLNTREFLPLGLAAGFIGMVAYHAVSWRGWKTGFGRWNAGHLFIAAMIVAFWGALMIWNYRPLRYQLVILYAVLGASAVVVERIIGPWRPATRARTPVLFFPLCALIVAIPVYFVLGLVMATLGKEFFFDNSHFLIAAVSALISAGIMASIFWYRRGGIRYSKIAAYGAAGTLVALILGTSVWHYGSWVQRATYIIRDTSEELPKILSPEAILAGPFAPNLTVGSSLKAVIHMFGVSRADTTLFTHFPVTHLILDEQNETLARRDYPEMMQNSTLVFSCLVGQQKVRLWRIAAGSGNRLAGSYPISLYEGMQHFSIIGDSVLARQYTSKYLEAYPDNFAGYGLLGYQAWQEGRFDEAERYFKKGIEFSPTNYLLISILARFYRDRYVATADESVKQKALREYERVLFFVPATKVARKEYEELRDHDAWQLRKDTNS